MLPLPHFDYIRPKNLREAIRILSKANGEARVLAGGTDLFVQMKKGLIRPSLLVDIKKITQLNQISLNSKGDLSVGAGVTLNELKEWASRRKDWFGLCIAAGSIGSEQVRNRGTVTGNLCRASPAGDMAPMLIALDGKIEIQGLKGKRFVPVEDFIVGPGKTLLDQGEMAVSLRIPKPKIYTSTAYLKLGARRAMETAIVSVAVRITVNRTSKKINSARIVLGAVAPTPIRIPEAEEILMRKGVTQNTIENISILAMNRAKPISDLRGTEGYRSGMVKVLTTRAVGQAWKQIIWEEVVC